MHIGDDFIPAVREHLFPSRHSIRTVLVTQNRAKFIGFVGNCAFKILGTVPDDFRRHLTALSEFAFYAGIGAIMLIIFTVASALLFQRYWELEDRGARLNLRLAFWANVCIVGGLFVLVQT